MGPVVVLALLVFNFFTVVLPILVVLFHVLLALCFILVLSTVMPQMPQEASPARSFGRADDEHGEATAEGGASGASFAPRLGAGKEPVEAEKAFHAVQRLLDVYRRTFCAHGRGDERCAATAREDEERHSRAVPASSTRSAYPSASEQAGAEAKDRNAETVPRANSYGPRMQSPAGVLAALPSGECLLPLILPPETDGPGGEAPLLWRRKQEAFEKLHTALLGLPPPILVSVEPPPFALPLDALLFTPSSSHTHLRFPRADGHPLRLRQIFLHVPLSRREQRWIDALHGLLKKQFRPLCETSGRDGSENAAQKREDASRGDAGAPSAEGQPGSAGVAGEASEDFESLLRQAEAHEAERERERQASRSAHGQKGRKREDAAGPYPVALEPVLLRVLWLIYRGQSRKFAPPGPPDEGSSKPKGSLSTGAAFLCTPGGAANGEAAASAAGAKSRNHVAFLGGEKDEKGEKDESDAWTGHAGAAQDTNGRFLDSGMTEKEEEDEAQQLAKAAAEHVAKMVAFRRDMFPLSDAEPSLAEDLRKGLLYWCGRDVAMRPVLVLNLQRLDAPLLELSRFLRLLIFVFEWGLRYLMVPGKVETCVVLLDLREVSLWSLPYSCLQTLVQTLTLQYPFRLRKMFVLHNSRLINGLWNIAKGFLTDVQQAKVATFKVDKGKDSPELSQQLLKLIPPSQLEAKYGGNRPNIDAFYSFPLAAPAPLRTSQTDAHDQKPVDKPMPGCWKAADLLTSFGVTWEADCRLPVQWRPSVAAAILRDRLARRHHTRRSSSLSSCSGGTASVGTPDAAPDDARNSSETAEKESCHR
ncbi:putative CRAL/TRIO domain-containing protein [Neospora caninum Liverpool]|uniref:CRAL/TRIO domain-containing protein, putative n=1 Tax=Neospora caninum (strain Liverpool) TaxID=572307 RepID=F0VMW4_NEOCL|nr:putative CRAL/TRIO domain-containing protein [Neospora caninum Liverpool]CBZ55060.1 putative CRAL/TRIO domain-containing protein [Neospora caninum Liverpool]CEL69784.1 TPA: CRAL/TRIO domain-containing protein, putative [Neospora caninum Liverpool]|eukprot:XP_003885088.1 putative CRAL/TRIO domain-containing protein [Neospora caninum Liverpool]